jgi:rhodanese-related sulfurtransferase
MVKSSYIGLILGNLVFLVIVYLIYTFLIQPTNTGPNLNISVTEARARRFGLIIDVRTPKEREILGYYPDSIPISLDNLNKEVPLDISNKNAYILIYSNGDSRAAIAAETLYKMGYRNVKYINETYLSLLPGSTY